MQFALRPGRTQESLPAAPRELVQAGIRRGVWEGARAAGLISLGWAHRLSRAADGSMAASRAGGAQPYLAGYLVGLSISSMFYSRARMGQSLTDSEAHGLAQVCVRYGAALATPRCQRTLALDGTTGVLKAHSFACFLIERDSLELTEEVELGLFRWLAEKEELPIDAQLIARAARWRERRRRR